MSEQPITSNGIPQGNIDHQEIESVSAERELQRTHLAVDWMRENLLNDTGQVSVGDVGDSFQAGGMMEGYVVPPSQEEIAQLDTNVEPLLPTVPSVQEMLTVWNGTEEQRRDYAEAVGPEHWRSVVAMRDLFARMALRVHIPYETFSYQDTSVLTTAGLIVSDEAWSSSIFTTPEESMLDAGDVTIERVSTQGDGAVELGEAFQRDSIDYSAVADHLRIHTEGQVAGSQFNSQLFETPHQIIDFVTAILPESLQYDQYGRVELTATLEGRILGFTGVKSLSEIANMDGVTLSRGQRGPGGEPGEVNGKKGAWYPETTRNPESGAFEVVTDEAGIPKNPRAKFMPNAWIASLNADTAQEGLATDRVSVIIQKDPTTGRPTVLTIYPGQNAPPQPLKIETASYEVDTLTGGPEAAYWDTHAFIELH